MPVWQEKRWRLSYPLGRNQASSLTLHLFSPTQPSLYGVACTWNPLDSERGWTAVPIIGQGIAGQWGTTQVPPVSVLLRGTLGCRRYSGYSLL